ncbi:MAG: Rieske 2Fe-2S domain-containing protein [Candidatus Heimdallarchaeota archaeon]|nr:Rieske 2Fe-2S domain-containing protein [Candidatus Heimdallarchaeota archaeon]
MELVEVCSLNEVREGILKSVDVEGVKLMVTKINDEVIVASRICTHKTYDLTKGHYEDGYVTCMLHTSVFDLNDEGEPMNPPATEAIDMYPTEIKNDMIYIKI